MNMVSPGSPWCTITDPLAAEAGARRRAMAWRMLSGSVKKIATRSRIWNRLRSSSGEPGLERSVSLTPGGIKGMGLRVPLLLPFHVEGVGSLLSGRLVRVLRLVVLGAAVRGVGPG